MRNLDRLIRHAWQLEKVEKKGQEARCGCQQNAEKALLAIEIEAHSLGNY
jgi:hypothetical protein